MSVEVDMRSLDGQDAAAQRPARGRGMFNAASLVALDRVRKEQPRLREPRFESSRRIDTNAHVKMSGGVAPMLVRAMFGANSVSWMAKKPPSKTNEILKITGKSAFPAQILVVMSMVMLALPLIGWIEYQDHTSFTHRVVETLVMPVLRPFI